MTTITRDLLKTLRPEIQAALAQIGKNHGLTIELGNATFNEAVATCKLIVAAPAGVALDHAAAADFTKLIWQYHGMKKEDLGRSFKYMGSTYKIKGLMPRRTKFPILCEKNGKLVLLPEMVVSEALNGGHRSSGNLHQEPDPTS